MDLFAGLLSGAGYLTHVKSWSEDPGAAQDLGHFFILVDTSRLGSREWLTQRMADFAAILHDTPPAEAGKPVRLPGEIELGNLERQRREGVAVDPKVMALLERYAARAE